MCAHTGKVLPWGKKIIVGIMRQVVLLVFMVFYLFTPSVSGEPIAISKWIDKAVYLEDQGHKELARDVLMRAYTETPHKAILKKWLYLDQEWHNTLKRKNQRDALCSWRPFEPNKSDTFKAAVKRCVERYLSASPWTFVVPRYPGLLDAMCVWLYLSENERHAMIKHEEEHPVAILNIHEVRRVLEDYDALKLSQLSLAKILKEQIIIATGDDLDEVVEILSEHKTFVSNIISTRCNYVSFNVISPYLARTEQLIFLSEKAHFLSIGSSSEMLNDAAKTLSRAAKENLLMESDEAVRGQFFEVYSQLGDIAGDAELEDLKALQALVDRLGKEKELGSSRWWK